MTKPAPLAPFLRDLTLDDFEIAYAYHHASTDVQAVMRHVAFARMLTPAQVDLLTRYAALSPERQLLVDDLVRHLTESSTAG
jgi:hypothetical protein